MDSKSLQNNQHRTTEHEEEERSLYGGNKNQLDSVSHWRSSSQEIDDVWKAVSFERH